MKGYEIMPLVKAICTNCGAQLEVNDALDAAICPHCNTAYIVEKAINNYNTTNNTFNNIHADNLNIEFEKEFVIKAGELVEYNGASVDVIVPEGVYKIGSAFREMKYLRSVTLPKSLREIGDYAFYGCTSLISVTIPDSVTEIGNSSFSGCTSLTLIEIPDSVITIGEGVFQDCKYLEKAAISNNVETIPNCAFSGCTALTSFIFPHNVTHIGESSFERCSNLTTVIIPDNISYIGSYAFKGCSSLRELVFPNENVSLSAAAFSDCVGLTSITVKNGSADSYYHPHSSLFDGAPMVPQHKKRASRTPRKRSVPILRWDNWLLVR